MHPELLSYLATEHCRDLTGRTPATSGHPYRTRRAARRLPSFRISWSRTTLSAAAGRRRGRSVVIVISATRTL